MLSRRFRYSDPYNLAQQIVAVHGKTDNNETFSGEWEVPLISFPGRQGFDICGSARVTLGGAMAAPPKKWKSRGSKRIVVGIY